MGTTPMGRLNNSTHTHSQWKPKVYWNKGERKKGGRCVGDNSGAEVKKRRDNLLINITWSSEDSSSCFLFVSLPSLLLSPHLLCRCLWVCLWDYLYSLVLTIHFIVEKYHIELILQIGLVSWGSSISLVIQIDMYCSISCQSSSTDRPRTWLVFSKPWV